ncbi:MAG: outer membrane protein OmpA-like peptidoglycan-associated protein [Sphingobacteriales bacterium]|jgi:outer membrane protein OmpA-like peptidoglycan-associated protein
MKINLNRLKNLHLAVIFLMVAFVVTTGCKANKAAKAAAKSLVEATAPEEPAQQNKSDLIDIQESKGDNFDDSGDKDRAKSEMTKADKKAKKKALEQEVKSANDIKKDFEKAKKKRLKKSNSETFNEEIVHLAKVDSIVDARIDLYADSINIFYKNKYKNEVYAKFFNTVPPGYDATVNNFTYTSDEEVMETLKDVKSLPSDVKDKDLPVITFDFGEYQLTADSKEKLKRIAKYLIENPKVNMVIEGHTVNKGSEEANFKLGLNRADVIKNHLVFYYRISEYRLGTESKGDQFPAGLKGNSNSLNRRVEFLLVRF